MKERVNAGSLFIVMLLWVLHLGYPLQRLQNARWLFLGYSVPIYYFFTVLPMLGAAAFVLTFKRHWSKWEFFWWALPLISLPGILHSSDPMWSLRQWLSWIIRGVVPGGIIFLISCRKKYDSVLLYCVYAVIIAASLLGLTELIYKHNPLWEGVLTFYIPTTSQPVNPFYRPEGSIQFSEVPLGTQGNRIAYASTLVGFLPLGLWMMKYKKRFYLMNLLGIGALCSILLLARVRSVWVATLAAGVLMYAVGLQRDPWEIVKKMAGALLCLGGFLAWPKTHDMLRQRFDSFHLMDKSIGWRLDILGTAGALKDHWLLGVGFGQFPTECKAYYHGAQLWIGTADNQGLRWVTENGIPSFLLLLLFFIGLTRAGWKQIKRLEDAAQADFYKSLLVGWLSVAVTFLFFDGFYWGACNMTFWCLLGSFAACLNSPQAAVND